MPRNRRELTDWGRRVTGIAGESAQKLRAMPMHYRCQFIVLDVTKPFAKVNIAEKPKMSEELPQPHVGR
jgi:hypothetical protein